MLDSFVRGFIRSSLVWLGVGVLIGLSMAFWPAAALGFPVDALHSRSSPDSHTGGTRQTPRRRRTTFRRTMRNPVSSFLIASEVATMEKVRVLLVGDHVLMRAGLRALLGETPDVEVVGEAATGEEALPLVAELRPTVVLMDLSMPGMGGLEATRRIVASHPAVRVLILTAHAEGEYLLPVLEAGGCGYVTKHSADTDLLLAIRTVAHGDVFLYPSAARLLVQGFRLPHAEAEAHSDPLQLLSERESEVLRLTAEGFTAAEIGEQLAISPKTVDTYRQRFMEKLGLHHRSDVVRFALQRGVLTASG